MNARDKQKFAEWFGHATDYAPYPFQVRFAEGTGSVEEMRELGECADP